MPPKDISPWIPLGGGNFDIVAVGLQESNYKEKDRDEKESAAIGIEESHQEVFDITEAQFKIESTLDSEDRRCLDSSPVPASFSQSGIYIADLKPNDGINDSGGQDVIIKRPRSHKSYRKVKRIVRKVSENIRESVSDVFDYPFSKQLHQQLGEQYILANKVELMEMRLFLFVHEKHTVTGFEKVSIPTGLGSVLGNKVRWCPNHTRYQQLIILALGRTHTEVCHLEYVLVLRELPFSCSSRSEILREAQRRCT